MIIYPYLAAALEATGLGYQSGSTIVIAGDKYYGFYDACAPQGRTIEPGTYGNEEFVCNIKLVSLYYKYSPKFDALARIL
jgi:hypothetical protein